MKTITAYNTPQQFLDASCRLLEEREIENNLILGLCNAFIDKTQVYENCVFINSFENDQVKATSIKTMSKAIVSGTARDLKHIRALADYYLDHNIDLLGVVGESFCAEEFSKFYGKKQIGGKKMIVHRMTSLNDLPLTTGNLEPASINDIDLLIKWMSKFEDDTETFPKQSKEQLLKSIQKRIDSGDFFKWVVNSEIVSIAAVVRKTRNSGIVGLVYTPENLRGKGYATSSVHELSKRILLDGFKYCGLFTEKSNPVSNGIYRKIGYTPVSEFADLAFG